MTHAIDTYPVYIRYTADQPWQSIGTAYHPNTARRVAAEYMWFVQQHEKVLIQVGYTHVKAWHKVPCTLQANSADITVVTIEQANLVLN